MREFTDLEKELLRRIANGRGRGLYSLIDPWIEGVSFDIDVVTNRVTFIFDTTYYTQSTDIINKLEELQAVLIQAVNLIKLFEDKGFFFIVRISQQFPNPFRWGRAIPTSPSIPYNFPDPRVSELIVKYSIQEIFLTPELTKFVSDNFVSREEFRANRQWNTTRTALWVTIAALFLNSVFNLWNIYDRNSKTERNIYNVENNLNATKSKSDTIVNSDTINLIKRTTIITKIDTLKNDK